MTTTNSASVSRSVDCSEDMTFCSHGVVAGDWTNGCGMPAEVAASRDPETGYAVDARCADHAHD